MPDDTPDGGGESFGKGVLKVLGAIKHGLGMAFAETRAAENRQDQTLFQLGYQRPDLLEIPEFAKATKSRLGLSNEGFEMYKAHAHLGGVTQTLAQTLGVPTTEPQTDEYDKAMIGGGHASPEALAAVNARPQVSRPQADILKESQAALPTGGKIEAGGGKSGQPKLTLSKGVGATARFQDQAKLMSMFGDTVDSFRRQGIGEVDAVQAGARAVMDYAAKNNMAAPPELQKAMTIQGRAAAAAFIQTAMQTARSQVQEQFAGPIAKAGEIGRLGGGPGGKGASPQDLGAGYKGIPSRTTTLPPELQGPTGMEFTTPDGRTATELTTTIEQDGRFYNVPLLVPGQTNVKDLLAGKPPTKEQLGKAFDYAQLSSPTQGFKTRQEAETAAQQRESQLQQHFTAREAEEGNTPPAKANENPVIALSSEKKAAEARAAANAKYDAKKDRAITETGETVLYPQDHPKSGQVMNPSMNLGEALDQGGIVLSKKAAAALPQINQATDFFLNWPKAADVLFKQGDTSPLFHSAIYAGIQKLPGAGRASVLRGFLDNGILPLPGDMKNTAANRQKAANIYDNAITTMEEIRNNLIIMLRSGMGERGNFAKAIVDKAMKSGPTLWDDSTTSNARMRFMAGMLAASKLAQGIPLTKREMDAYQKLDQDAAASGLNEQLGIDQLVQSSGLPSGSLKSQLQRDLAEPDAAPAPVDERTKKLRALLKGE